MVNAHFKLYMLNFVTFGIPLSHKIWHFVVQNTLKSKFWNVPSCVFYDLLLFMYSLSLFTYLQVEYRTVHSFFVIMLILCGCMFMILHRQSIKYHPLQFPNCNFSQQFAATIPSWEHLFTKYYVNLSLFRAFMKYHAYYITSVK